MRKKKHKSKKKAKISKKVTHSLQAHMRYGPDAGGFAKTSLFFKSLNRVYSIGNAGNFRFKKLYKFKNLRKRFMRYYKPTTLCSKLCLNLYDVTQQKRERGFAGRRRYVYRIDEITPKPRKKIISKQFSSLRFVRMFYFIFNYKQFKKMARKAKKKDGFFESNYLMLLEGRIAPVVYRVNFCKNMFEALRVAKLGIVGVNKRFKSYANFLVSLMKFIGVHILFKGFVYFDMTRRLIRKSILHGVPNYVFMSFTFFTFFLKKLPTLKSYINPMPVDIFRATGYAY